MGRTFTSDNPLVLVFSSLIVLAVVLEAEISLEILVIWLLCPIKFNKPPVLDFSTTGIET